MKLLDLWTPRSGFGEAVGCVATSFTFDTDFFWSECLARFLGIVGSDQDAGAGPELADIFEEEEKLTTTRVSVLVDQSQGSDARNLRWDLLQSRVRHGLLHSKVTVLVWENAVRIVVGSANLQPDAYRSNIETAVSIEITDSMLVDLAFVEAVVNDLRDSLRLCRLPAGCGPIARAEATLNLVLERAEKARIDNRLGRKLVFHYSPSNSESKALAGLEYVWAGSAPPQELRVLSPFLDSRPNMPGARALLSNIATKREVGKKRSAVFVVPISERSIGRMARAPRSLLNLSAKSVDVSVRAFKNVGDERNLHAKVVQYLSDYWLATMVGSSNATSKGLGIDPNPHRESNVWIGCPRDSKDGKALQGLITFGEELNHEIEWEAAEDPEDHDEHSPLPDGFQSALLTSPDNLELRFDNSDLPGSWALKFRGGQDDSIALDSDQYLASGKPSILKIKIDTDRKIPHSLLVTWGGKSAHWSINVEDKKHLPAIPELKDLTATQIMEILGSSRAIQDALREFKKSTQRNVVVDDDALRRFDSADLLVNRIRMVSAALAGIKRRLNSVVPSEEAATWRYQGPLGPVALAQSVKNGVVAGDFSPDVGRFIIGELLLTLDFVRTDASSVQQLHPYWVEAWGEARAMILEILRSWDGDQTTPLHKYIEAVVQRVMQW